MDLIKDVGNGTWLIADYFSDTKVGFQAFFIASGKPAVIEPGPPIFAAELPAAIKKLGHDAAAISYIIPTHIHADHCGGAGNLVQIATHATILAHPEGAKHLGNVGKMEKATRAYWSDFYEAEIGSLLPVPEDRIGLVNDGDAIDLGDRTLTVIHTPGHAKHHLCLYDGESGDLFCGEAVGLLMPGELKVIPILSPPVFEVTQALDSINKMRKLMISRILFSHYGMSDNPARCLDLAEESIKTWGDLVLRALKAHKSRAEIKASLAVLLDRRRPEAVGILSQLLEWAIDGYSGYFIREGMASDYPGRRI